VGHDPRVPAQLREEMNTWGWAADEFTDNGGFPHQMYVREARRMIGAEVMTEHHCVGDELVDDPIALAAYTMDSHNCQRVVIEKDGVKMVKNEGNVEVGDFPPYPISYLSLTPKAEECTNLLVPVCLSASHIAYGSIRMEPVFMVLGEVAAIAADLAMSQGIPVQEVNHEEIVARYEADPLLDGSVPEITVDERNETQVDFAGEWAEEEHFMRTYGPTLRVAHAPEAGTSVTFRPEVKTAGRYTIYLYATRLRGRDISYPEKIPATVRHAGGETETMVAYAEHVGSWAELGSFDFAAGEASITLSGAGLEGVLVADALLLMHEGD
jgi:hypothetical protein